ncbi:YopX family protein [Enterococcus faecium]|uniref:YopX family protein n=1 Tax=Enterococcus faecium TaxID=1352 RepID=UPI0019124553|nr:YopX family protein [Enterococcus faecium]MBK5028641.1 hypothetical protein [Enterococcus faecium]MBK5039347.1 hypothetical protein [Enterococcus faecium]MBK5044466.1 hypothetical protein [Enterococcus faecium]MBK5069269.1 hypothetical protein [Enterococcus faecium]MBK5132439.1 hypothetical protein [Enterococcus faecium]
MIPKFRLYDPSDQKIREVAEIDWSLGIVGTCGGAIEHELDKVELMQSTGLKDKNGVEIFEGDLVQWGDTPDWEEEPIRVAVVKINPDIQFDSNVGIFEYGRFIYRDTERFLTVLGNVYENSELLEEQ